MHARERMNAPQDIRMIGLFSVTGHGDMTVSRSRFRVPGMRWKCKARVPCRFPLPG